MTDDAMLDITRPTLCKKNYTPSYFCGNFVKSQPIFKILSPLEREGIQ